MTIIDRDPTPEDLEAERDAPRVAQWAGDREGRRVDFRRLTQDETDCLIRIELRDRFGAEVAGAFPEPPQSLVLDVLPPPAQFQRGGIDSDPLVRVLAYRAWGNRDRLPEDLDRWSRRRWPSDATDCAIAMLCERYSLDNITLERQLQRRVTVIGMRRGRMRRYVTVPDECAQRAPSIANILTEAVARGAQEPWDPSDRSIKDSGGVWVSYVFDAFDDEP